jgi:hypothetical protein
MAQMSSVRNKQKREALLQQANALLADMADAPAQKNKKKDEESSTWDCPRRRLPCRRDSPAPLDRTNCGWLLFGWL